MHSIRQSAQQLKNWLQLTHLDKEKSSEKYPLKLLAEFDGIIKIVGWIEF